MIMKRLLAYFVLVAYYCLLFAFFARSAFAADSAMFSASSENTSYKVGDEFAVTFSVDAGPYASTLSTMELWIKVSDISVIEPVDKTNPFTAGSIYPSAFGQSIADNTIHAVLHINPESKPASRSGEIAKVNFKALKEGSATISYDKIEAAAEDNETEFISTSAGSLVIDVSSATTAATTDSGSTTFQTVSPSATVAVQAVTSTSSGPEMVVLLAILGGVVVFFAYKMYQRSKRLI